MKCHGLQLTLLGFLLITSCNKDDFYGTSVAVEGIDAACSAGIDEASCEGIQGCQSAFEDVESVTPVFAACIADPPPIEVIISGDSGGSAGSSSGEVDASDDVVVTVKEAYDRKCADLDEKYLLNKNYSDKGKGHKVTKVKLCHQTSSKEHAIIVACPALKAHRKHDDYLGACKVD